MADHSPTQALPEPVLPCPALPEAAPRGWQNPVAQASAEQVFTLVHAQMRKLAGHRDVEELTQMAAEQAIRGLPSFEHRSELATWTYRICYLTVRKHDRWYQRWLRRFTLTPEGDLPSVAAQGRGAEQALVEQERLTRLRAALESLSPRRRAVVILHDLEGLSMDEVATIVGAGVATARSRLRDGRRALALHLADDSYFGEVACQPKVGSET